MKTNRDQLANAFNHLREDTLEEAMTAMETPTPAVTKNTRTRRWLTATAACLTAVLALGAVLALPLLITEEPVPPSSTELTTPAIEENPFFYDANLVKLMSLSDDEADRADTEDGADVILRLDNDIRVFHYYYFRFIGLEDGETVTPVSRNAALVRTNRYNYIDPVYTWEYRELYQDDDARLEGNIFEDYVDFVIRDANGNFTGAGCLDLADKKVMKKEENNPYFNVFSISRGKVLGSVRFTAPATVTEEQVEALLADMKEGTAGMATTMFDEATYTRDEMFIKNWAEILETEYPEYMSEDAPYLILRGGAGMFDGLRHLLIATPDKHTELRSVFFFKDGTYAIAEPENCICICPFCGEIEYRNHVFNEQVHSMPDLTEDEEKMHRAKTYWLFKLNDGRTLKVSPPEQIYTFLTEPETAA